MWKRTSLSEGRGRQVSYRGGLWLLCLYWDICQGHRLPKRFFRRLFNRAKVLKDTDTFLHPWLVVQGLPLFYRSKCHVLVYLKVYYSWRQEHQTWNVPNLPSREHMNVHLPLQPTVKGFLSRRCAAPVRSHRLDSDDTIRYEVCGCACNSGYLRTDTRNSWISACVIPRRRIGQSHPSTALSHTDLLGKLANVGSVPVLTLA